MTEKEILIVAQSCLRLWGEQARIAFHQAVASLGQNRVVGIWLTTKFRDTLVSIMLEKLRQKVPGLDEERWIPKLCNIAVGGLPIIILDSTLDNSKYELGPGWGLLCLPDVTFSVQHKKSDFPSFTLHHVEGFEQQKDSDNASSE